ncbi:carboxymuconolactone decarboxylase family protein [Sphingorhabdus sp. SMR4y]|uniref:carboxymuconolactone decarboxylase family protein n=1 Tax=Sphingorhabdus sp. SMR4y TaxID=2584094 RepID=UPI000B5CD475|nr:carboxymuconolactone decarboxylase family protein [Sphingorhabdus sp. SMR4y]ASK88888.1 carboxymuconolactone decarboxylase family protein [Sphingorhabdus sp. SMR4y]
MTRIKPLSKAELPEETLAALNFSENLMGYVPNSVMTMAHWPELLLAFRGLVSVIYGDSAIDNGLKRMIGAVVSAAAGCRYCMAHSTLGARDVGVDEAKVQAVWEYQTSDLFSDAERAALDLAFAAGQVPNAATDDHFLVLDAHYDERQKTEIMAVIGMFGFLNRWNDTLVTGLEDKPFESASALFRTDQWQPGAHRST